MEDKEGPSLITTSLQKHFELKVIYSNCSHDNVLSIDISIKNTESIALITLTIILFP